MIELAQQLDETDGDLDGLVEAWLTALLDEATEQRDQKLDNYASYITELEARAAVRLAESKRLADRARADQNRAKWLKERLQWFFAAHGLKTIETARYRLTLATNGGKAPLIVDESVCILDIPDEYLEWSAEPDRVKIREALEAGESLPFARLGERGQSIRIK